MTYRIKNVILLFICLSMSKYVVGQRERTVHWYFGYNAGIDFQPTVSSNNLGQIFTWEGCASISDSCGNLLFYTDGTTVYNKIHTIMDNGTGLEGNFSSTQSALIIPKPQNDSIYYVFTTGGGNGNYCYSEINMNLSGGLGSVVTKNIVLCNNYYNEKQAAVMHCNNQDIWVVCGDSTGYNYFAFLVTNAGVSASPLTSYIGISIGGLGYLKFSPNGSYLANANSLADSISISYFDNCTGQITPFVNFPADTCVYGLSFSGNSSKLYAANTWCTNTNSDLWQYDLTSGVPSSIVASKTLVKHLPDSFFFGALQLGADGRIYIAKYKYGPVGLDYLGTIDNPDSLNTSCNYSDSTISIAPMTNVGGLPNFIESYFYFNYSCPTLSIIQNENIIEIVTVYPNPFSSVASLSIVGSANRSFEFNLYDSKGILKKTIPISSDKTELNRYQLDSGIYFYQLVSDGIFYDSGTIIIE